MKNEANMSLEDNAYCFMGAAMVTMMIVVLTAAAYKAYPTVIELIHKVNINHIIIGFGICILQYILYKLNCKYKII